MSKGGLKKPDDLIQELLPCRRGPEVTWSHSNAFGVITASQLPAFNPTVACRFQALRMYEWNRRILCTMNQEYGTR